MMLVPKIAVTTRRSQSKKFSHCQDHALITAKNIMPPNAEPTQFELPRETASHISYSVNRSSQRYWENN